MKWLVGLLAFLNIFVFTLAWFAGDEGPEYAAPDDLPDNVQSIALLPSGAQPVTGACTNLGPIARQDILNQFAGVLEEQAIPFQVIPEPSRMVTAYRVVIPVTGEATPDSLKTRLNSVGVNDIYQKTSQTGEPYLSLGVFTYERTARDFAANLSASGFSANYQTELLEYPPRYWLNLKNALDNSTLRELNQLNGSDTLRQSSAPCT